MTMCQGNHEAAAAFCDSVKSVTLALKSEAEAAERYSCSRFLVSTASYCPSLCTSNHPPLQPCHSAATRAKAPEFEDVLTGKKIKTHHLCSCCWKVRPRTCRAPPALERLQYGGLLLQNILAYMTLACILSDGTEVRTADPPAGQLP
jgi:hypothetical protein